MPSSASMGVLLRIKIVRVKREMSPVTFPQGHQHLLQGGNILVWTAWDKTEILKHADSGTYERTECTRFSVARIVCG